MVERQYAAGKQTFYRFFNPVDYATQNMWEADQGAAKPASFSSGMPMNQAYYFNLDFTNNFEHCGTELVFPREHHWRIFSYAAQGRIALWVAPTAEMYTTAGTDMVAASGMGGYGMDNKHIFHKAAVQHGSRLVAAKRRGRGLCWHYWRDLLENLFRRPRACCC